MQDLRLAFRTLLATPVATAAAVLSLALGIGANTATFSLVDRLVLRSLPVREPARLALVTTTAPLSYRPNYSYALFDAIAAHTELFDGVLAVSNCCGQSTLAVGNATELVDRLFVSGSYFTTLGVNALLGRALTPADDLLGGGPDGTAAVLSYTAWQRRFNGDLGAIGRRVLFDRVPVTIVGVLPPSFVGTEVGRTFDVFLPARRASAVISATPFDRHSTWLNIIVRLKPGQTIESSAAALRGVEPSLRSMTRPPHEPPAEYLKHTLTLAPAGGGTSGGTSSLRERFEQPLVAVFAVVLMVLLIAAANVANMQLARVTARRHELSVRLALGSSRWELARLLIAESALLAAAGTAIGIVFAKWTGRLLIAQLSTSTKPISFDGTTDWRVLTFAGAVMIVTTVLFGGAPAVLASRVAPIDALKDRGQEGTLPRRTVERRRGRAGRGVARAARRFLPGASPLGRSLTLTFRAQGDYSLGAMTVVGVVRDSVFRSIRSPAEPTVYLPLGQRSDPILTTNFWLGVRSTRQAPQQLTRAVSAAILALNRDIVLTARPMSDEVRDAMAQDRIVAELSGFFGGLALLLAGLGLYGVTSYAVARRRAEIGIRMALGAAPAAVILLVLARATMLVAIGIGLGAGFSFWASKFAGTLLFGREPRDVPTLVGAAATLGAVGALAAWLPARRASRLDPADVLRDS